MPLESTTKFYQELYTLATMNAKIRLVADDASPCTVIDNTFLLYSDMVNTSFSAIMPIILRLNYLLIHFMKQGTFIRFRHKPYVLPFCIDANACLKDYI